MIHAAVGLAALTLAWGPPGQVAAQPVSCQLRADDSDSFVGDCRFGNVQVILTPELPFFLN